MRLSQILQISAMGYQSSGGGPPTELPDWSPLSVGPEPEQIEEHSEDPEPLLHLNLKMTYSSTHSSAVWSHCLG